MNLIQKRLLKTRIVGQAIARLPFVCCVILNGSLASGGHKKSSDIDILIIAKDCHIFTARFFVNVFAVLFGLKRSKDSQGYHAGKFCFNYFLTENYLKINYPKEREKYCAGNYSKSQFVAGDMKLFEKFMLTNQELFSTYDRHPERLKGAEGSIDQNNKVVVPRFFAKAQNDIKTILFDWLENILKKYQIKKIESDTMTKKYPDLIVYNDKELRFHPPKRNRSY